MSNPPEQAGRDASGKNPDRDLIPLAVVAGMLRVEIGTLYQWKHHKKNLKFYKSGRKVLCDRDEVRAYIEASASEPAA